jgi:hypothetical protein
MKATMRCVEVKVWCGVLGVPYFSVLCPENIGSAKKLYLACQEEFGVGAPSFLQAGVGEKEYKSTEGLCLGNFCSVHIQLHAKDLGAFFLAMPTRVEIICTLCIVLPGTMCRDVCSHPAIPI